VKILCRIYAKFDRKDIWFDELPKTTVSNEIRYIIPIDRDKGIIMISYTDSKYAKYWGSMPNKKAMIDTLHEKIQKALNITIAKPKDVCAFYWNTGTAYWKPNVDSRKISAKVLQPDTSREFYICGENYSESQGWIEGALETSNHVIRKMTH
jgi:monoamine oxidase